MGAFFMILLAIFGKLGGLFASVPKPVIGGILCVMFSAVASVGLSALKVFCEILFFYSLVKHVNLSSPRNLFVIGFSILMGLSLPQYFEGAPRCLNYFTM